MSLKSEHVQPKATQLFRFMDGAEHFEGAQNAEPAVGEILILCPRTSAPIPTGLRIDWVVFKSLPPVAVPLRCPACRQIHNGNHRTPGSTPKHEPAMHSPGKRCDLSCSTSHR
jgi:hypothetical protein